MTAYEKIYEQTADNYGFITTRDAVELGVPKSEMSALAKRKRLVHKGYGVYRLATHYQPTEFDGYAEAVLLLSSISPFWRGAENPPRGGEYDCRAAYAGLCNQGR